MHKYFFEQLQMGEELLQEGDIEASAQAFTNAIVVSGQPMEMLRSFGDNLPPRLFDKILELLPVTGRVSSFLLILSFVDSKVDN